MSPDVFDIHHPDSQRAILILCDHARNHIPEHYQGLGLSDADLKSHIAYDLGAADLAMELADRLSCSAILSSFSRLLIDPNRGLDDPTLVMKLSDGHIIPGNRLVDRHSDVTEFHNRIETFYRPYHQAIAQAVDAFLARGIVPLLVSMHSFTPIWKGEPRPWQAAILWDSDTRLRDHLVSYFMNTPEICFGDNEPYSGRLKNDTMYRHATAKGLPHGLIEVRQDITTDPVERAKWADQLAIILERAAADPLLQQQIFTPSSVD